MVNKRHPTGRGPAADDVLTALVPTAVSPATPESAHLAYLSQTALEFVSLPPDRDVYQHTALRLKELAGNAVVVIASYEPETHEICQRAVVGAGHLLDSLSSVAGTKLRGFRSKLNEEAEQEIRLGRLLRVREGLYEAMLRSVPRPVTRTLEKMAGIESVYGMGCVAGGTCLGTVLLMLRAGGVLPPAAVLEAFIRQAALAMQRHRAESALVQQQERFRALMERATDACLTLAADGTIRDINPGGCSALGYARPALLGKPLAAFLDPNELVAKPVAWDHLPQGEGLGGTRRVLRADGTYAVFEARIVPLGAGQVLVVARDITESRRLEKEVAEASRREREAVGRDLHDSLGQQLTGLSCLCAGLAQRLAAQGVPEAAEAERIAALLGDSVGQARRIAQGLCLVDVTEYGTVAALSTLADHMGAMFDVNCRFIQDGPDTIPRDATASHLYLIAQEAATNAIRHGRADTIDIELCTRRGHGQLVIRDNGTGMPPAADGGNGLGLRIMKYRAGILDGALEVNSTPDGTTVQCSFPLPA